MRNKATKNRNQAPRNTAIKLALNPKVQVVAPAMYKAFRQADLHTNICRVASGYYDIGSRTLLIGKCSRELSDKDYIVPYIAMKGVRNECRISALPNDTGMFELIHISSCRDSASAASILSSMPLTC